MSGEETESSLSASCEVVTTGDEVVEVLKEPGEEDAVIKEEQSPLGAVEGSPESPAQHKQEEKQKVEGERAADLPENEAGALKTHTLFK